MRLFVGIFPPVDALSHLGEALASVRAGAGVRRWQPADRWHVTLAFLGDVPADRFTPIAGALAAVATATPALTLRLGGSGTFRTGRGAGALWIGADGQGLAELAALVAAAVPAQTDGRPFRAHLTVARWRPPERPDHDVLAGLSRYRGPTWQAEEILLVRSHLGAQPRYERLDACPMTAPPSIPGNQGYQA